VGEKIAAVSPAAQTTRNRILGIRTNDDREQIILMDTPGFHVPRGRMNRNMIESARSSLLAVDVIGLVLDASEGLGKGDGDVARLCRTAGKPVVAVLNKIDLVSRKESLLSPMKTAVEEWGCEEVVPVSALTGEGCEVLLRSLVARLPEGPMLFPPDQYTDQPERRLAEEWIREKVIHQTRQEIPHATAVVVDRWVESSPSGLLIEARVLVERESQKGIVVGKGGERIKQIGIAARKDLEDLLAVPCTLMLRVQVRKNWRNEARTLGELGIGG
jgi:GTP-binding protein Era